MERYDSTTQSTIRLEEDHPDQTVLIYPPSLQREGKFFKKG